MRLSALSNPIAAGIDAYARISGVLNENESMAMRRKLLDQQLLESESRMGLAEKEETRREKELGLREKELGLREKETERHGKESEARLKLTDQQLLESKQRTDIAKETHAETQRLWFDSRTENNLLAGLNAVKMGIPLSRIPEDQQNAILIGAQKSKDWSKVPVEEWENLNKAKTTLREKITEITPIVQDARQNKKRIAIDRSQMPDLFSALDNIPSFGARINRGDARGGANVERDGVKKSIEKIMINGENDTISFVLRVETKKPDGSVDVYFAPKTMDSGVNPDAPITEIPIALLGADQQVNGDMQRAIEGMLIQYGVKGVAEKVESLREKAKNSEAFAAGENAAIELWTKDKTTPVTRLRLEMKRAARAKAKEMGTILDEKELDSAVKELIAAPQEMTSQVGKQLSDRARLVAQYGEDSDQVKLFDEQAKKNKPKTTEEKVDEAKKVTTAREEVKAEFAKKDKQEKEAKEKEEEAKAKEKEAKADEAKKTALIDKRLENARPIIKAKIGTDDAPGSPIFTVEKGDTIGTDDEAKEEARGRKIAYEAWTNEYIRKYNMDPQAASAEALKQIRLKIDKGEKFYTMKGNKPAKVIKYDAKGKRVK